MTATEEQLVNTEEAAAILGVKPATIYTYVTRGNLEAQRLPGDRSSWFKRSDLDLLKNAPRRKSRKRDEPLVKTSITLIDAGYYWYRGLDPAELAAGYTFEQVAELLWTGAIPDETTWRLPPPAATASEGDDGRFPLDRLRLASVELAVRDHVRFGTEPEAVKVVGRRIIATLVDALPLLSEEVSGDARIAARLWPRLTSKPASPERLAAVNGALIIGADHGMSPSTRAARLAASFRTDPHAAVEAGLAVLSGGWHGGRSLSAEAMLRDFASSDVATVVGRVLRRQGSVPCLGHLRYPDGDPRTGMIMSLIAAADPDHPVLGQFDELVALTKRRALSPPSYELALAAMGRMFDFISGASEAMFGIARTAGWVAHALEAYEHPLRRAPHFEYTGRRPSRH